MPPKGGKNQRQRYGVALNETIWGKSEIRKLSGKKGEEENVIHMCAWGYKARKREWGPLNSREDSHKKQGDETESAQKKECARLRFT